MVGWIKSITKLPVILKGILTAEDAKLAVQHGADAIIVSNHGGRSVGWSVGRGESLSMSTTAVLPVLCCNCVVYSFVHDRLMLYQKLYQPSMAKLRCIWMVE